MDTDQAWQDLAAAALLGTERRAFTPPVASGPIGDLLAGLEGRGPEKALLGTAAALALFRKAGRLPSPDPSPAIDPAGVDDRPRCSAASGGHLAQMLGGTHAEALPEWLAELASAGKRPGEEAVPGLLDAGRAKSELRPAVAAAVGPLGAWLAGQNPDWAYAAGAGAEEPGDDAAVEARWQTGTLLQRSALLRKVRESDPARGRALVASTWEADPFEARASFVEAFQVGLGPDDEPFLEARLDDRRKEVRLAASHLLARLPGSGLVARMAGRVAPLLGFSEAATREILGGLKGKPLEVAPAPSSPFKDVTLPEACDKSMVRDGVEPKPGRPGIGEKAWWLSEMLARVPPSAWSRAWGLYPTEALAVAAVQSKWNDALHPGLVEAAVLHRDFEWLDALLPHRRLTGKSFDALAVLRGLPPDRREATIQALIRADDIKIHPRFPGTPLTEEQMHLLDLVPSPWGEELSSLVAGRMSQNLADKDFLQHDLIGLLKTAARGLAPAAVLANPPRRTAGGEANYYLLQELDRHLEAFHALIQFRHDMIQELRA